MSPSSAARAASGIHADFFVDRWLFDGLNALLNASTASGTETLGPMDIPMRASALYDLIGLQLPSLPTLLNATHDEAASDSDDPIEAILSPTLPDIRAEQILDMLSVFDSARLPEEYGRGFTTVPPNEIPQSSFVPGSLAATIYRLAVQDDSVFRRLRRVITHDICANAQFSKLRARAREAFAKLDNYIEDGPSGINDWDIPMTAKTLRLIIDQISQSRDFRASTGPLSPTVVMKVAEILTEILQEVCQRNEDVYYRIGWNRDVGNDEPERNRNLYAYLIEDPPRVSTSSPVWMSETFVVDRLRQMPANEWRHLIERLTSILDQIREYMPDESHPPPAYVKLERMIREYTTEAFEPSSSSVQRRPTLGIQRETRRRRFD
ncbi:MAG: hypothetical protein Q9219_001246 [cf. Caloplaca sp. 3 TL-2023]